MSSSKPDTLWQTLDLHNTTVRLRMPQEGAAQAVAILLHGWTGDETFMAPFAAIFPPKVLVVSFRAPWPARSSRGGYSWVEETNDQPPQFSHYLATTAWLSTWVEALQDRLPHAPWQQQHWMGFSQGAAVAAVYALAHPQEVASIALLAGFLPHGAEALAKHHPLEAKPAFVAHGLHDNIVPIHHARHAVDVLTQAGARVVFCTDDVAHKVGARCRKALGAFYSNGFGLTHP